MAIDILEPEKEEFQPRAYIGSVARPVDGSVKKLKKRTESILQQTHTAIIRTQRDEHRTLNHVLHRHKQQPSNRERQVNQHRRMYQCSQCSYIGFLLYPKQRTVFSNYEHCPIYPRRANNTHTHRQTKEQSHRNTFAAVAQITVLFLLIKFKRVKRSGSRQSPYFVLMTREMRGGFTPSLAGDAHDTRCIRSVSGEMPEHTKNATKPVGIIKHSHRCPMFMNDAKDTNSSVFICFRFFLFAITPIDNGRRFLLVILSR